MTVQDNTFRRGPDGSIEKRTTLHEWGWAESSTTDAVDDSAQPHSWRVVRFSMEPSGPRRNVLSCTVILLRSARWLHPFCHPAPRSALCMRPSHRIQDGIGFMSHATTRDTLGVASFSIANEPGAALDGVAQALADHSLPQDAPLSVLAVELLPSAGAFAD